MVAGFFIAHRMPLAGIPNELPRNGQGNTHQKFINQAQLYHTTSPLSRANPSVTEEEQMNSVSPGMMPVSTEERIPVYRTHENDSDRARWIAFFVQSIQVSGVEAGYTPDEFGNQVFGHRTVNMSINEYRQHLAEGARMRAMAQSQVDWLHPGQQWELGAGRAYALRCLIRFIIDFIGDDYHEWAVKTVLHPKTVGEVLRVLYEQHVNTLAEKLALSDAPVNTDDFVELVYKALTGEGMFTIALNDDASDYETKLSRILSQLERQGAVVDEIDIPDDDNEEIIVRFIGMVYVVPKIATVKLTDEGELKYNLWSNKQVAHTINWLVHNNQSSLARELVIQFPILEHGRNKFMYACERRWASNTVLHVPALALGLRGKLGAKTDKNVKLAGNKVVSGKYNPIVAKLIPIREIGYQEGKLYQKAYPIFANLFPYYEKEEDDGKGGIRIVSVAEQWARLLPGIGETNANWLKHGKYVFGEALDGCNPAPGKISKRTKLFTGAAFWALIPENINIKLTDSPEYKEKLTEMAAKEGVTLTDDDFSTVITEEMPFDAKGGIYVSEWLADHIRVMYKDGTFHRLSDGDKCTRLVGQWCVKGLVHVRKDLDADIVLGEDCIKFFANDDFAKDERHRFVIADIASDYLKVGIRKVSTQVSTHYPEYMKDMINREIERRNIKQLTEGIAPVDDILRVLSFPDATGNLRLDPAGEMVRAGIPLRYEGIYGRFDHNWWDYLRQEVQQCIDFRVFGIGGKLVVAPVGLKVAEWVDERWIDNDDERPVGWSKGIPLPSTAISVPYDAYVAIMDRLPNWWLKQNSGIVAAQSSFPFTGRHGMVKVKVYAHNSRHRCVFVGADLLDLVERDCDGDPEAAILDPEFIERCAVSYDYARRVRDEIARRTEPIIKLGKDIAKGKANGSLPVLTADGQNLWKMMPEYPHLPTQRARRAADCIELAGIDHMGLADNLLRRVKTLCTDLALYDENARESDVQFRRDVELGVIFQATSQLAVGEKEGTDVVAMPTVLEMVMVDKSPLPPFEKGGRLTYPNVDPYLRLFGISKQDVPDGEELVGQAPLHFKAVNGKRDRWADLEPSFRHPWKFYELTSKNTVDAFRKVVAACHKMVEVDGSTDPYAMALACFHSSVAISEPLMVDAMGEAISNVLSREYHKEIHLDRDNWFNTLQHVPGRNPYKAHEVWWNVTWTSWHDCPKCGEVIYPGHTCTCKACGKRLYGVKRCNCVRADVPSYERMKRNRSRDWDECIGRLDRLFDSQIVGYTTRSGAYMSISEYTQAEDGYHVRYAKGQPSDKVVDITKRRLLITGLFADYNKDNGGRTSGYGNTLMIARHLDPDFFDKVMIELHYIAGSDIPAVLFDGLPTAVPETDDNVSVVMGCFANATQYTGPLFSIANSAPHDFASEYEYQWVGCLAPSKALLATWKREKDIDNYVDRFREEIRENKEQVERWIANMKGDEVLLCWEPAIKDDNPVTSNFCHRILIGKYIKARRPEFDVRIDGLVCPKCGRPFGKIEDIYKGEVDGRTAYICGCCHNRVA